MIKRLLHYFSLVKFSHTIFAMPFALLGFFLAVHSYPGSFQWQTFVLVVLCMVFARNAAMAFNRYIDRDIDKVNPRTAEREIPKGVIHERSALFFVVLNCILFVLATSFINPLVLWLSPIALLVILGYSYTKRFTHYCHLVLGLGLSLSPIGAYLAVTARFDLLPILFSLLVLLWTAGFDMVYALQDEQFDKDNLLHSIPARWGERKTRLFAVFLHLIVSLLVLGIGFFYLSSLWYWIGAFVFIALLFNQHRILRPGNHKTIKMVFFTHNGLASIVYAFCTILSFFFLRQGSFHIFF